MLTKKINPFSTKIDKDFLIIFIITLIASVMSVSFFSTGHLWWDDFASYILQARAILEGRMAEFVQENGRAIAQSTYPVGPAAYPWGFPLLLAPIHAVVGMSITAFKLVNTAAFAAFLVVFYCYARSRFDRPLSAALASVLAFSPALLKAHDLILADFSFLFAASLAVFLLDRQWRNPTQPAPAKFLLGGMIFFGFFLRTNGILLLGPLLLVDFLQWRAGTRPGYRLMALPYLVFFSLFALSLFIFPGGQSSYFNHYELFFSPARLFDNIFFYLTLPGWLFDGIPLSELLFALTGLACLWGILQKARAELPALAFSLLTLGIFITWPERQGLRFIYPILPFYLIFAAHGLNDLISRLRPQKTEYRPSTTPPGAGGSTHLCRRHWRRQGGILDTGHWTLPTGLFGVLAIVSLVVSFQSAGWRLFERQEINGPFDPVSAEMFAYIRENTATDSTLVFFKPRLMKLMTERYAILLEDCARIAEADYVVIHEKQERNGQIHPDEIKTCNPSVGLQVVFKNQRFTIYLVNKP
jgi:hypothetical protein